MIPLDKIGDVLQIYFENVPKRFHSHIESIITFSANKLLPPEVIQDLDIEIQGSGVFLKNTGNIASVINNSIGKDPRDFFVEVDTSVRKRTLLTAIAHEMVHIKQFALNELVEKRNGSVVWKRKRLDNLDYYEQPWEIEAYGREAGLFVRWCEQNNLSKFKWTQHEI